jgi:hypothetical protein
VEEGPEKQDTNNGSPKDTDIHHPSIMAAIDFVEVLARPNIVFTGYLTFGISPVVSDVTTISKVLNMSSFHYADDDRMKEESEKVGISI